MVKNYVLCFSFLLFFQFGNSQILKKETLSIQGSSHFVYANNKSYFIQESIGQASVINTFSSNNYSLRQGFLQPISASIISSSTNSQLNGIVFPNPFTTTINIKINEPVLDVLLVWMFDVSGKLLLHKEFSPNETISFNINNLANGQYFIHVKIRSQVLITKLIKQ